MSLDDRYLRYDKMRYGMDHERYPWSMLERRAPIHWPGGRPLAVWINVCLEHFPLNPQSPGFKAPGNMSMPYPDLRHYTLRDYGNRVGIFRVLEALTAAGLKASFAVNGELAERYPWLLRRLVDSGAELIAHGWNMDCAHSSAVDVDLERDWIQRTLAALARHLDGAVPAGWLGPARSQSSRTPELLAEAGMAWFADWVNDDLPYPFQTECGALYNLPLSFELEDRFVIDQNLHSETEYADQIIDAFDFLRSEAEERQAGRLLAVNLHPWIIGQAHRIGQLERVFEHFDRFREQVWNVNPSAIVDRVRGGAEHKPRPQAER